MLDPSLPLAGTLAGIVIAPVLTRAPWSAMMQPGEYYNKEANLNADIRRFRRNAYTKDLMAMAGTQALSYCATSSWSPCSNEDATYDDAGIV